jgi:type I restriction enzyme S subunit
MEKYDDYKDSGVKQIGQIPRKWEVKKLKYLTSINQDSLPEHTDRESDIYYVDIGSVTMEAGINEVEHFKFGKAPSRARRLAKKGDTIISTVRTYLKAIGYVGSEEKKYVYSTGFAVLQPSKKIVPEYLYSFVKSDLFTNQVDTFSIGISYPAINSSTLGELYVAVPPKDTQATIATYLDQKTAQIDTAISQKEQLIELLKERKQTIIQYAVTRGLNETVELKDSGVRWVDEIPVHWDFVPSTWLFTERKDKAIPGDIQLTASQKHGVIPQELFMELESRRVVTVEYNYDILKHVEAGDFVISMRSFQGGLEYSAYTGCVSSAYVSLVPSDQVDHEYFSYFLKSYSYISELQTTSNLVRDGQALRYANFRQMRLPLVPLSEQNEIASYIKASHLKIDKAIQHQTQQIAKLREYRTVLIDAAVTGKIKVG